MPPKQLKIDYNINITYNTPYNTPTARISLVTKLSTKSTKNEIGFSVVSDSLHAQLFPNYERTELLFNGEVAMVERWLAGGPLTLDN